MATKLFFRTTASDFGTGTNDANLRSTASNWSALALSTTAGASVTASLGVGTVAGATPGVETQVASGAAAVWYSPPLDADITISGSVTWNIWASESDMSANVAINGRLEVIDGATGTITLIDQTARVTEVAVTTRGLNNFAETPAAGVACKRGDRLRVRIFADDAGTMASGFTFNIGYNGGTGAADGDTWLQLTENLTFVSEPAGTTIYPTDTASAVDVSADVAGLLSSFTGSDENPLSEGGNWAKLNSAVAGTLTRSSNQVAASSATGTIAAYWTPANFGPDVEAYVTIATAGANNFIWARVQGEGGSGTYDGYGVQLTASNTLQLYRFDNIVSTSLIGTSATVTGASGDKLGISCIGPVITAWHQPSGGSWRAVASATDTTYPSAGKVAIGMVGSTSSRMDDVYAATGAHYTFGVPTEREAWTSRGAGVQTDVTNTVAAYAAPAQVTDTAGGTVVDWFTRQLTAFTLGGAVRVNVRGLESVAGVNGAFRCEIARVAADGTSPTVWGATTYPVELGTTEAAQSFLIGGDDLAITDGQRLRIRFYTDEYGVSTPASTGTVTLYYAGTSGGASGDTYLTFTQTLTEFSAGTTANAITATATGDAHLGADAVVATLAVATTTGTANNPTARPGIATITDAATATGAALSATTKVTANLGVATATGTAHNASVSTAVSVTAGVAAATASAGPAAVGTSPYSTLIVQDGPAGYWRLGEASGNPQDTSGHGNHVTSTGGTPTYSVTGSLAADPNTAITLDGSTEYFSVPQDASLHGNTISIELWFKRAATGGVQFVWDNGYGDSELYFSSDVIYFGRAGVATLRQSAGTYTDTDWHHLVAVKDGASSREIYVDGVAVGTGGSDSTLANANGVSGIGAQQAWSNHWNGSLDEVAVYAYALSAGQVLAHYTAGAPAAATSANAEVATATGAALDADAAPGEYVNPDAAAATGTALGTTTSIAATVGVATATGAALNATASTASMVSATAQVATATGAAVAAAPSIAPDLDAATATGTAITATAHETQPANLQAAAGTGEALGTDAKIGATSVVAAATGAALSPDAALKVNAGVATGTGAALVADGLPGTRALANVATATGAALVADGLPGELAPAEVAATAGAAQNGTTKIAPTLQTAAATGAANNATVSVASTGQVTGQTALASGAALNVTAKVVANLSVATGTGSAANPSVSTSLARTPGVATGTGAAVNVTAKVVVNAATAAATGTAANATVTTTAAASATAQVATAQGAAHAATVGAASTISANAAAATATGTAYNATIIVAVAAAAASSTGTAAAASIAVAVAAHAQTATATGTAYDAGVALGAVAALAEVAVATGIAYNARAQTAIGSGIDTAGGIHGGIVSLPAIRAGVAGVPGVRGGIAVEPGPRGGIVTEPRIKGRVA